MDYIIIYNRFFNAIKLIETYPGANIDSDIIPETARIQLRLKKKVSSKSSNPLDIWKFKDQYIENSLTENINRKFEEVSIYGQILNKF